MHYPFPDNSSSFWLKDGTAPQYPKLQKNLEADVVIVGGGIAGLTTAYVLKQSGLNVVVLERRTIAGGTTSGTTGKVTAQHGLIYAELLQLHGREKTQLYADAYMRAMHDISALITSEKIDCQWSTHDNYVYTADSSKVETFQNEVAVAASLGLPASFETRLDLPFSIEGAVKFSKQASFDANKYCHELAKRIHGDGSFVFEQSKAVSIQDGDTCRVSTMHGEVRARHIVIATLVPTPPLIGRASYGLFESPETSYIVAGKTDSKLKGMYISPDKNHYSILPFQDGDQKYMLIGGEAHIPGLGHGKPRKQKLADYANKWFGVEETEYQWAAMDYMAYDKLPLIGKLYPWSKNTYAISGFKKWGLSSSMVAAQVIRDLLQGQHTPEAELFRTHRGSASLVLPKKIISKLKG